MELIFVTEARFVRSGKGKIYSLDTFNNKLWEMCIRDSSKRDINIAFVNELSKIFTRMGIDTQDVLEAASTKLNFLPFKPGLVGGHCIGVDPYYLCLLYTSRCV